MRASILRLSPSPPSRFFSVPSSPSTFSFPPSKTATNRLESIQTKRFLTLGRNSSRIFRSKMTMDGSSSGGGTARTRSARNDAARSDPPAIADIEDFHALHDEAMRKAESTYIDPSTGFMVFTELTHLKRGKCCGNRCRHCPYGFEKVRRPAARGSWRRRRAAVGSDPASASAASVEPILEPIPGAPVAKLRSGDREKAQNMVREILERAGKWNPGEDGEESTRGSSNAVVDSDDDSSSASESSSSSCSSSSSSSCSSTESAAPVTTAVVEAAKDTPDSSTSTSTSATASLNSSAESDGAPDGNRPNPHATTNARTHAPATTTTKNVPYTRGGDQGTSQLGTGERRSKTDDAFEAMGSVDELCSFVGVAHSHLLNHRTTRIRRDTGVSYGELPVRLLDVMSRLFDVGSHIAKPQPAKESCSDHAERKPSAVFVPNGIGDGFDPNHVDDLEDWINEMTEDLPELTSFILPTGAPASAALHVARTVCRRAERRVVPIVTAGTCDPNALRYLNRLSDFFFVSARWVNFREGQEEIEYRLDLYDGESGDGDSDGDAGGVPRRSGRTAASHDQRGRVHRSLN